MPKNTINQKEMAMSKKISLLAGPRVLQAVFILLGIWNLIALISIRAFFDSILTSLVIVVDVVMGLLYLYFAFNIKKKYSSLQNLIVNILIAELILRSIFNVADLFAGADVAWMFFVWALNIIIPLYLIRSIQRNLSQA